MTRFLLGFVGALVLLAVGALLIVWTGAYDVAADNAHFRPVRWALDAAMHNAVERRARDLKAPVRFSEEQIRDGFAAYDSLCVHCHGAPGANRSGWANGMRPRPPDLWQHAHWSAPEVFWIVKHGIKMSGMPAFGQTHDDARIWNIVAFVERLPSVTPEQYENWRRSREPVHHGQASRP